MNSHGACVVHGHGVVGCLLSRVAVGELNSHGACVVHGHRVVGCCLEWRWEN